MAIFCLIYIVYKADEFPSKSVALESVTQERSDVIVVNACDVESLMFYTLSKLLSESIFNQSGNSVDPDQI